MLYYFFTFISIFECSPSLLGGKFDSCRISLNFYINIESIQHLLLYNWLDKLSVSRLGYFYSNSIDIFVECWKGDENNSGTLISYCLL